MAMTVAVVQTHGKSRMYSEGQGPHVRRSRTTPREGEGDGLEGGDGVAPNLGLHRSRSQPRPDGEGQPGGQAGKDTWDGMDGQGQRLCSNGWLNSARGCLFSTEGTRTREHLTNQDAMVLWEGFSGDASAVMCAVMDGHGPHGARVAQSVCGALPDIISRKLRMLREAEALVRSSVETGSADVSYRADVAGQADGEKEEAGGLLLGMAECSEVLCSAEQASPRCASPRSASPRSASPRSLDSEVVGSSSGWGSQSSRASSPGIPGSASLALCSSMKLEPDFVEDEFPLHIGDPEPFPRGSDTEVSEESCPNSAGSIAFAAKSSATSCNPGSEDVESVAVQPVQAGEEDAGALPPSRIGPETGPMKSLETSSSYGDSDGWAVPQSFLEDAFMEVNEHVRQHPDIFPLCSGSAVALALLQGRQLTVAHLGDSRCILGVPGANGRVEAIQLTVDHRPCEASERRRIEAAGGRVLALREEPDVARMWLPDQSVPGLALSRTIGHELVKEYGVTHHPDVLRIMLDETAKFIIVATYGLWGVVSPAEAAQFVAECCDRVQAAERLTLLAKRRWLTCHGPGNVDDVSVVVYFLSPLSLNVIQEE